MGRWQKLVLVALSALLSSASFANAKSTLTPVENRVRHELVMLPWLTVFDNLTFQVDTHGNVILSGATIRPTVKSAAENVVRKVEGVASIDNRIEVLPLSPFDDGIRLRVARAIYGYGPLQRYGLGTQPSVRIIVKNGHVTLEGFVANQGDRNIAFIRANGIPGVFSVTNNLQVEHS